MREDEDENERNPLTSPSIPKNKQPPLPKLIFFLLFSLILYLGLLLITFTFTVIHSTKMKLLYYFLPLIILTTFAFLLCISKFLSDFIFSITYTIFGVILAMELYMSLTSLIILLLSIFIHPPFILSYFIILIIPLITCIYGVINVFIPSIDIITLKSKHIAHKRRIVHLTDLHLGATYQKAFVEHIIQHIRQLQPDVVVITGDLPDGVVNVKSEWLTPFDELTVPVLYVTGNHEHIHGRDTLIQAVNTTNMIHVECGVKEIEGINFIGVDYGYELKNTLNQLATQYKNTQKVNVVLHHIPCIDVDELEMFDVFLLLSGHTHGGQVFPFHIVAYLANKCFNGLYKSKNGKSYCYVSPGVGASVVPMRVGVRSVIGVIDIEREEEGEDK